MTKEQEVIKRLNFHKEYARLSSNRVVISETDLETVLSMLKEKDKEIENKDKIIDLMAEQLAGLTIWNNEKEEPLILADKEEVIKYFEKKRQNVAERKSEEWKLK